MKKIHEEIQDLINAAKRNEFTDWEGLNLWREQQLEICQKALDSHVEMDKIVTETRERLAELEQKLKGKI